MAMEYHFDDIDELRESAYQAVLSLLLKSQYTATKGAILVGLRQELEISNERHLAMMKETKDAVAKGLNSFPQFAVQDYGMLGGMAAPRGMGGAPKANRKANRAAEAAPAAPKLGKKPKGGGAAYLEAGVEAMILRKVRRNWPEQGGWFEGVITDYDPLTDKYCITYDLFKGQDEQHENICLSEAIHGQDFELQEEVINPKQFAQSKVEESRAFQNSTILAPRYLSASPYKGPKRKSKGSMDQY